MMDYEAISSVSCIRPGMCVFVFMRMFCVYNVQNEFYIKHQ